MHLGDNSTAIKDLQHVLQLSPNRELHLQLAGLLLLEGQTEDAKVIFMHLLEQNPSDFIAKKGLGDTLYHQKNYKGALEQYHQIIEEQEDADVWYAIAETYYRAQDHDRAIESIEYAISIEPKPEFFAFKGDFFIRHDNFERALEQYILAKNMDPNEPEIRLRLGFIYRILDRPKDALQAFNNALRLDPELLEALENKYQILLALDREIEAFSVLQQLAVVNPEIYALRLAQVFLDDGEYEGALKLFTYLTDTQGTQEALYGVAYTAFEIGRYQEALEAIDKLIVIEDAAEYQQLRDQIISRIDHDSN